VRTSKERATMMNLSDEIYTLVGKYQDDTEIVIDVLLAMVSSVLWVHTPPGEFEGVSKRVGETVLSHMNSVGAKDMTVGLFGPQKTVST